MKLERVVLHKLRLPLLHPFETSFGRTVDQETLLVEATADGVTGWGECPAGEVPGFSYETAETARYVLRNFFVPALARNPDPGVAWKPFRGHPMARHALESALRDAAARAAKRSLSAEYGGTRERIESGISLGIEPDIPRLLSQVERAVARGYRRVKLKIKPGWDLDVLTVVRSRFPDFPLSVDANGAYSLGEIETLKALDGFRLMMMEQPLAFDDLHDHAELARSLSTPICLDESIRHASDARKALATGACRILNIKSARVGGPAEAKRVHDVAAAAGAPVWCGGLLESGVGRLHNVALASLPNFSLPGDISPSERYYAEDVIDPPVAMSADGWIDVRREPGLGAAIRWKVLEEARVGRDEIRLD